LGAGVHKLLPSCQTGGLVTSSGLWAAGMEWA